MRIDGTSRAADFGKQRTKSRPSHKRGCHVGLCRCRAMRGFGAPVRVPTSEADLGNSSIRKGRYSTHSHSATVMTSVQEKTRFLLALNLFLQLLDGCVSYGLLSAGVESTNQSVHGATPSWGVIGSLFYNKTLASTLLLLIYVLREKRAVMVGHALTIIASVYACHSAASILQLCLR